MYCSNFYNNRQRVPQWSSLFSNLDKQIEAFCGAIPTTFDFGASVRTAEDPFASGFRWYESDDAYHARVDLPGVDVKDVELTWEDGVLRIVVFRRDGQPKNGETDRNGRRYEATVSVPEGVDVERISASQKNGVLSVEFPKSEKAKPRRIEIVATGE